MTHNIKSLIDKKQESILKDYFTFLRFPSISSEREFQPAVIACAHWVEEYIKGMGFDVSLWPTSGHPVLFATHMKAGPNKPTLLIYNHYDVQPVDPLEEWETPPFEPTERGGEVYARGAQDNKGQCFYVMQALKLYLEIHRELPINIKWCIEGEEEVGSTGLSKILADKKEQLKADYLVIVDVGIPSTNIPAVTLGARGIVTMDLELVGSTTDMHSGSHGGIAFNPIHALVKLLEGVRDAKGRVTIPGFYDDVIEVPEDEKKQLSFCFDKTEYLRTIGAEPTGGEHHYPPNERSWLRPTLEVNGISGGYAGNGFKTVIPAKALAKISCRLVPNQDPQKIGQLVASYFKEHAPGGVKVNVHIHTGQGEAVRVNPSSKVVKAFAKAYEEVFKVPCQYILAGGSIPIVAELARASGAETVLVGLGLSTDQIHAPNEHFGVDRIKKGIEIIFKAIQELGR